jgi:hypothetical protein
MKNNETWIYKINLPLSPFYRCNNIQEKQNDPPVWKAPIILLLFPKIMVRDNGGRFLAACGL